MTQPSKQSGGPQAPWAAVGAIALVALCCGGHALLLGALGSVALGSVLGAGAGVLVAVVIVTALVVTRRRRAATLETVVDRRQGS
jgi:hypothetical protein